LRLWLVLSRISIYFSCFKSTLGLLSISLFILGFLESISFYNVSIVSFLSKTDFGETFLELLLLIAIIDFLLSELLRKFMLLLVYIGEFRFVLKKRKNE